VDKADWVAVDRLADRIPVTKAAGPTGPDLLVDSQFADREEDTKITKLTDTDPRLRKPSVAKNRASLLAIAGPHSGLLFTLEGDEIVIGRGKEVGIQIHDVGISRRHSLVRRTGDFTWEIVDLESTNGTYVDGQKVESKTLREGDRIQIGRTTVLKFTIQDELEQSFQKDLYDSAMRDPLTHAYNRRYFHERLRTELAYAARHGAPLSLILIDLDHFKHVNDTYGHLAGDAVLKVLTAAMHRMIRTEDLFARIGGEEFALVLRGIDEKNTHTVAERARKNLAALRIPWEGATIQFTVSCGVVHTLDGSGFDSPEALYAVADARLYAAKAAGRNQVVASG
jgi:diguanylate cyclase (GGDEF)-like protein